MVILLIYFGHVAHHVESQFPNQGSNPCPLQWKHGVLITEPPRKSLHFIQNSTRRYNSIWAYTFSFSLWFRKNFRIWDQWRRGIGNLSESWNVSVSQEFSLYRYNSFSKVSKINETIQTHRQKLNSFPLYQTSFFHGLYSHMYLDPNPCL